MPSSLTGYSMPNKFAGYKVKQLQQYTPQQMQLFDQLMGMMGPESYTGRLAGGDEQLMSQLEEPALQQFGGIQGQIASRFSRAGSGARHSSGFQNTMTQAGSDFASSLQNQRLELQRQAIKDLQDMGGQLLNKRPYEQMLVQPTQKKSFWQQLIGGAAPLIGGSLGFAYGGPSGAAAGARMGSSFGQSFY